MEIFETILIFLAVVIVSSFVHTFIPKVPLAFIQIILGMILFILPVPVEFNFDSELFMLATIAPLLFVEGVNVSRVHLRRYIKPVMLMALGLVITTVIGVGLFIHLVWQIYQLVQRLRLPQFSVLPMLRQCKLLLKVKYYQKVQ